MFYKPRLRKVWFRGPEDKGGRWQVSRIESFVEGGVYEPGFEEWVRCEYTERNKHEQKCGARNEHQTQHSAGAQWMLTEWVYEWKCDFHGRQFEYQLDWHEQLRDGPRVEGQQHQILEGQAERRTWSNREHLLVPRQRVTTVKRCLGGTPQVVWGRGGAKRPEPQWRASGLRKWSKLCG